MGRRFFLVYCALFAPFALITPYFQQLLGYLGYGPAQLGWILGGLELMAVLAPMLWGMLADRLGSPRGILLLTSLLSVPSLLLFQWTESTCGAVCAALLFGLFYKTGIPLTDGLTFRYIREHGGDYGKVRTGGTTGYLVFIGVFDLCFILAGGVSSTGILVAFCGAALLQLLSLWLLPRSGASRPLASRSGSVGRLTAGYLRPVFLLVILVAFMGRVSMMSYYSFFSRFLSERYGMERIGLVWGLGSLCEIPLVYYSHRIMGRIGVKGLLLLGLGGIVVRLAGFGLELGFWFVLLLQPLHMLTFGAYHCSTLEYVGRLFPADRQASAQGIFSGVTIGLGGLLGSAAGGMVIERFGYDCLYMSCSGLALAALLICLFALPDVACGTRTCAR